MSSEKPRSLKRLTKALWDWVDEARLTCVDQDDRLSGPDLDDSEVQEFQKAVDAIFKYQRLQKKRRKRNAPAAPADDGGTQRRTL